MTSRSLLAGRARAHVVAVIASPADLNRAVRMRKPPDLYEVRLDCLVRVLGQLEQKLPRLRAPLIITARHSKEGGANKLSLSQRRDLLIRFLPCARYIDIELRSLFALRSVLASAEQKKVRRIFSFHDFKSTPPARILSRKARAAQAHGANVFKVATRTETPIQLARLLNFLATENVGLHLSVMGMGKLGAISRVLLARAGSAFIYASIGTRTNAEGQLSLEQLRALGVGK